MPERVLVVFLYYVFWDIVHRGFVAAYTSPSYDCSLSLSSYIVLGQDSPRPSCASADAYEADHSLLDGVKPVNNELS